MGSASSIQNRLGPYFTPVAPPRGLRLLSGASEGSEMTRVERHQVQLDIPYGRELRNDERVKKRLDLGWRIAGLQRLSDQEVLVTFEATGPPLTGVPVSLPPS